MARGRAGGWKPTTQDFARVLEEQNPWFQTGEVPLELAPPKERFLARSLFRRVLENRPHRFHLLIGPRRVGKTTAMYQTVRHLLASGVPPHRISWLNLAHPLLLDVPLGALVQGFLQSSAATPESPVYLCLDELSYAERWDLWLKDLFDRKLPVRIIGTSSATAILHDQRQESGVGRWDEHYLPPYLFGEYLDLVGHPAVVDVGETLAETLEHLVREPPPVGDLSAHRRRFLLLGGFPELLLESELFELDEASVLLRSQATLRSDAVQKAVYQDIPQAYGIERPKTLERMLYMLAGQIAGILKPESLCQSLDGLSVPTFEKYLSYLEHSFIVFTTPNYSGNEETIQRRGRKVYFVDPAVRNAALQRGIGPLSDHSEMGLLIENMAAAHLHALGEVSGSRLFHWRTSRKEEVDCVLAHPTNPVAIEIGGSIGHNQRGLKRFLTERPEFAGQVYLSAPGGFLLPSRREPPTPGVIPLELFLLAVSRQMEREVEKKMTTSAANPADQREG